jgi:murein DD-endopeptidase MepM/ murein hydrolase activator NlpD
MVVPFFHGTQYERATIRLNNIKNLFLISFIFLSLICQAQIPDQQVRDLKSGRVVNDTTPIYRLPWALGTRVLLVQGWQSNMSHKGELSQDFKMKLNTPIYAARGGIVVQVKSDGKEAGLKTEYLSEGNNIVIMHSDSTFAGYWHLSYGGVYVKKGDTIKRGRRIGLSGHTGFSAFPHLHFMVFRYVKGEKRTIPIRFQTHRGVRYLRPGKRYKAV